MKAVNDHSHQKVGGDEEEFTCDAEAILCSSQVTPSSSSRPGCYPILGSLWCPESLLVFLFVLTLCVLGYHKPVILNFYQYT